MLSIQSLILTGLLLAAPVGAQALPRVKNDRLLRRANAPREVHLDLRTGTYTRGPVASDRGQSTVTDLTNVDIFDGSGFGWVSTDTGGGSCTWIQMAAKGLGVNQGIGPGAHQHGPPAGSNLMSNILFFYCSGALDPNSGGPGGSVELGFYEGYTIFGGAPTTTAVVVSLTGMPGNTAPGGFFAGARCYGMNVDFNPLVAFDDALFVGYSWHYEDVGTDGVYGATFPFIACVVSCSGTYLVTGSAGGAGGATGLGEDGQGMLDAFDAFCTGVFPNGPTANTFTFTTNCGFGGLCPPTRASIGMEVREKTELQSTDVDYNDTAPIDNVDTLTATSPILGSLWTATFTRDGGGSGRFKIVIQPGRLPGGGVVPGPPVWQAGTGGRKMTGGGWWVYVPPSTGPSTPTLPFAAGTGTATAAIPLDIVFCGLHFTAQARSGTGPAGTLTPRLSSAIEGTIGTH